MTEIKIMAFACIVFAVVCLTALYVGFRNMKRQLDEFTQQRDETIEGKEPEYILNETSIYNKETVYPNCTVIVWDNTITGDVSYGWRNNDEL